MSSEAGGSFTTIALMMLIVGMAIPVTAALNAIVGTQLSSFGAIKTSLTVRRALGLLVMAIGVYLAKKPR